MNVAFHVANALLLFLALASITGEWAPSFVVAGLFALHPANVESVAWISQRKTTLATLFGILAIWSYARYARAGKRSSYVLSLTSFALSLLSKQMFVTLPFALLLLDYWPLRRAELEPRDGDGPTLGSVLLGCPRRSRSCCLRWARASRRSSRNATRSRRVRRTRLRCASAMSRSPTFTTSRC
jgi:hypothetical protein